MRMDEIVWCTLSKRSRSKNRIEAVYDDNLTKWLFLFNVVNLDVHPRMTQVNSVYLLEQSDLLWTGIAGLGNASSSSHEGGSGQGWMYSAKARRAVIQDVI